MQVFYIEGVEKVLKKFKSKLYDESQINEDTKMFSNQQIWQLLIPLIIEQILNSLMGMADTMMVSNVGDSAIAAVSSVDTINILIIQVFGAMATGGAIICAQYLGRRDKENSNKAARQVVLAMTVISLGMMIGGIVYRKQLLNMIFGEVEQAVMSYASTYFLITILSYPFLALFNAGSAFYRVEGNSEFPMKISVISNVINVIGNMILIFGFHMGVMGAALSTLAARVFCMVVIFYFLRRPKQVIVINNYWQIRPDFSFIKRILAIGIPSGIENGMFQLGKLVIQSTVSELGTTAMAAQAMTNMLENINGVVGGGIGIGLMTVIGQCMGVGRKEEAKYYMVKLTWYAEIGITASCLFAMAITKPVTLIGRMKPESAAMCFEMMKAITMVKPLVWTLSFVPAYGMRAAGDVRFSMIVTTITMWTCRVAVVVYLCKVWGFGPMAVWIGMFIDWTIRAIIFTYRFFSGKWLEKQVI